MEEEEVAVVAAAVVAVVVADVAVEDAVVVEISPLKLRIFVYTTNFLFLYAIVINFVSAMI